MAVLKSSDFVNLEVVEGKDVPIEFTVKNENDIAWPFKPLVQNEKDTAVRQHVPIQLQPGQETQIKFVFRAPLSHQDPTINLLLQLVDPLNYEKFCEKTVVVICQVLPAELEDETLILEHQGDSDVEASGGHNSGFTERRQELLDMIDKGLEVNRMNGGGAGGSSLYDDQSLDTLSILEHLDKEGGDRNDIIQLQKRQSQASDSSNDECNAIIQQSLALLVELKLDQNKEQNEESKGEVDMEGVPIQSQLNKLGQMIQKAQEIQDKPDFVETPKGDDQNSQEENQ